MQKNNSENDEEKIEVEVPNLIGLTIKDAKKVLEEIGLEIECENTNEGNTEIEFEETEEKILNDENIENTSIGEQTPKPGIKIKQGNRITVKLN